MSNPQKHPHLLQSGLGKLTAKLLAVEVTNNNNNNNGNNNNVLGIGPAICCRAGEALI